VPPSTPRASIAPIAAAVLLCGPSPASAETALGHEVAAAIGGVYDGGDDRGVNFGAGYELSWSVLRVNARLAFGDSDPRQEQHWALGLGAMVWKDLRFDVAFHHRAFTQVGFGENLLTFAVSLEWHGFDLAAGYAARFPILDRAEIHNPFVFDRPLFAHFIIFRLGWIARLPRGVGLGVQAATFSRFELFNLDYPQFSVVVTFEHARVGKLRLDVGIGTAGFFNQGSTIDRGFVRLEYARRVRRPSTGRARPPRSREAARD
jgi:hypothetical protein